MDKLKKALDSGLVILAFVGVLLITFSIFYNIFNNKFTISVNNIGDQLAVEIVKDDLPEGEYEQAEEAQKNGRLLFEANVYSNENGNGKVLEELKFNYFSDVSLDKQAYRSSGMQNYDDKAFGPLKYYYYWAMGSGVYKMTSNPDYVDYVINSLSY